MPQHSVALTTTYVYAKYPGMRYSAAVVALVATLMGTKWGHPVAAQPRPGDRMYDPRGVTPLPSDVDRPRRYGDAGTHHLGLSFGIRSGNGGVLWAVGAQYGRFLIDGLAPTLETSVSGGTGALTVATTMAALRWLPWRGGNIWPLIVPRAGRVIIQDRADVWGAGGTAGVIVGLSGRLGLQLAYDYLRLFPEEDCTGLSSGCSLHNFGIGLVIGL